MRNLDGEHKPLVLRDHNEPVTCVAWSPPDGRWIASGGEDSLVKIWDVEAGESVLLPFRGHEDAVTCLAFNSDGTMPVSGSRDKSVRVWDGNTGQEILLCEGLESVVRAVDFGPGDAVVLFGDDKGTLHRWNLQANEVQQVAAHDRGLLAIDVHPYEPKFATAGADKTIMLWDAEDSQPVRVLRGHTESVTSLAFSPNGEKLLSGSKDQTIRVWETTTGENALTLRGHEGAVVGVAWAAESGEYTISASRKGVVKIWKGDLPMGGRVIRGFKYPVGAVAISPVDGSIVAGGYIFEDPHLPGALRPGELRHIDGSTLRQLRDLSAATECRSLSALIFSPKGRFLCVGGNDTECGLLSCGDWKTVSSPPVNRANRTVAFSPDGRWLVGSNVRDRASSGTTQGILVWDRERDVELAGIPDAHGAAIFELAFSPDNETFASVSADLTVKAWNIHEPEHARILPTSRAAPHFCVAFGPAGKLVASGGAEGVLLLWDVESGRLLHTLSGHEQDVCAVVFTPVTDPARLRLFSASCDGTIKIWSPIYGREIMTLRGHGRSVNALALSGDGVRLVSGGSDKTVRIWDAPTRTP